MSPMDKLKKREQIIREYTAGGVTTRTLGIKYGYCFGYVAKLVRTYHQEMGKSKLQLLQASKLAVKDQEPIPTDVKQLQEELRMSRLKICLLEAMIDISDEQFGTDIRKKAGTRRS
jgi:hypothetical protein